MEEFSVHEATVYLSRTATRTIGPAVVRRASTCALTLVPLILAAPLLYSTQSAHAASSSVDPTLPPTACVEALRSANIERLNGNTPGELTKLRAAQAPCDSGITGVAAMLRFHRRAPLPADEFDALSRSVIEKTSAPGFRMSFGVAQQLVRQPDLDPDILRRVVDLLEERYDEVAADRAAAPASGAAAGGAAGWSIEEDIQSRVLRVVAEAHERLEDDEKYVGALERLFDLAEPDDVAWSLLTHYREAENWDRALELLEHLKANNPHLQSSYVLTLARAGRREPLMKELEILARAAEAASAPAVNASADDATGDNASGAAGATEKTATAKRSGPVFFVDGKSGAGNDASRAISREVRAFTYIATEIAWQFRDGGHDEDAETVFRRIVSVDPDHILANQVLLHHYGSAEERAAYQDAIKAQRAATTDPVELVNQGADLLAGRDYQGAYDVLLRVVNEFTGDAVLDGEAVWYNFAIAAYRVKQWEDAATGFSKALEHSERVQSLVFGGMSIAKLGRHQEAVPMLQRALTLDPNQSSAHYQLWVSFKALGNEAEAAKHRAAYDARK